MTVTASSDSVPFLDLTPVHAEIAGEVEAGWSAVISATDYASGEAVREFEREFARYCGTSGCAGVANGTDALELALRSAGIRGGDEVIIPANTFIATAEAAERAGASVVLADVCPSTLLLDPDAVAAAITPRTTAIVPVHLYGQLCEMERLEDVARRAGLVVVEDAAQSHGARRNGRRSGSFGSAAATSFYPGKNLGAYGEAGAVTSSDSDLIARVRTLRNHGGEARYVHQVVGCNSRMDSLQAVVLRAKLRRLDRWNAARRLAASRYFELLQAIDRVELPGELPGEHVWHLYVVQVDERDRVHDELSKIGIGVGIHYPSPIHLHAAYAYLGLRRGAYPIAEAAARRILSLPMHPYLTQSQQERVAAGLRRCLS